jgi:hypothetical protein
MYVFMYVCQHFFRILMFLYSALEMALGDKGLRRALTFSKVSAPELAWHLPPMVIVRSAGVLKTDRFLR